LLLARFSVVVFLKTIKKIPLNISNLKNM